MQRPTATTYNAEYAIVIWPAVACNGTNVSTSRQIVATTERAFYLTIIIETHRRSIGCTAVCAADEV